MDWGLLPAHSGKKVRFSSDPGTGSTACAEPKSFCAVVDSRWWSWRASSLKERKRCDSLALLEKAEALSLLSPAMLPWPACE